MRYIVIPSAKFAPLQLNNYGDIPMALYPINNSPIIRLILSEYTKNDKFILVGFEGYSQLSKYAKTIKDYNVEVIKLEKLSNLSYSIEKAIDNINFNEGDELIVNFADTVVDNNDVIGDTIIYKPEKCVNSKWSYFVTKDGIIDYVIDKRDEKTKGDYKLICGVFSISSPKDFLKELKRRNENENIFDCIIRYSYIHKFKFIEAVNWLDIGHPEEYFNSKIAIKSREFNHMFFDKNRGILRKTSDDKKKFVGEIEWYIKLPKQLKYVAPRIFDYSTDYNDMFIEMEFYSYPTLLELNLYGNLDHNDWKRIFSKLHFVLDDFKKFSVRNNQIISAIYEMYYKKTIERLKKLRENNNFITFFEKNIEVNGIRYISLDNLCLKLEDIVKENLLNIDEFNIIHGDMCFANILVDDKLNFIKLIDPRGNFGGFDIFGDQRYELAKLMHSIDGKYDYIIKDLFDINVEGNSITLKFEPSKVNIYQILVDSFNNEIKSHQKEIEIIESLLFLSMIPLHNENINHQYAMLAVGLQILNRWIDIKQ